MQARGCKIFSRSCLHPNENLKNYILWTGWHRIGSNGDAGDEYPESADARATTVRAGADGCAVLCCPTGNRASADDGYHGYAHACATCAHADAYAHGSRSDAARRPRPSAMLPPRSTKWA